jgi:hypothetical protein
MMMKNIFLSLLFLLTFNCSQGQLTLTNGKRTKVIDNKQEITLRGKEITSLGDTIDFSHKGFFLLISNDSIVIKPTLSKLVINSLDKRNIDITTDYWIDSITKTQIAISTIKNIKTTKETIDAFCSVIGTLGFLTSTIIAPLVSIKYKDGTINKSKYVTLAGLSIAAIAVSITFDLTVSKRKFNFFKTKNPWKILK